MLADTPRDTSTVQSQAGRSHAVQSVCGPHAMPLDPTSPPRMRGGFVIRHRLYAGWGWERLTARGEFVAESYQEFETRQECIEDARAHAAAHKF